MIHYLTDRYRRNRYLMVRCHSNHLGLSYLSSLSFQKIRFAIHYPTIHYPTIHYRTNHCLTIH
jgi:hypothetical protein